MTSIRSASSSFLRSSGLPHSDQEDCLQTIWSELVGQMTHFQYDPARGRLATWLMTVVRNRTVDAIRCRRRRAETPLDDPESLEARDAGPASACESLATQHRMRQVLDNLSTRVSPLSFQVLYQRAIVGRSTTEVADALGLTPGQVRFRLHRMKLNVRDLCELKSVAQLSKRERMARLKKHREISRIAQHTNVSCEQESTTPASPHGSVTPPLCSAPCCDAIHS